MNIIIGNYNYSSWSLRGWLVLERSGLEFDTHRVALDTPEGNEYIARHCPANQVPVLEDVDIKVWDTLAIAEYLAESNSGLWPEDKSARAAARSVTAQMHSGFSALRNELPMNSRRETGVVSMSDACVADCKQVVQIWDDCRAQFGAVGPWLFGQWSIADAFYAPVVLRFHAYQIDVSESAAAYIKTTLEDRAMMDWREMAAAEPEVIESEERS